MANNIDITPGTGKTIKTTDNTGVHTPHHNIDAIASAASPDIGAVADAAVITDTTGSLSAKLRGLVKWAFERMPAALGQTTMSASIPVAIASNQSALQLAAGTASIGTVQMGDSGYTQVVMATSSADMSSIADVTPAPTAGQHTVVESVVVSVAVAMVVTLKEETTGTILKVFNFTSSFLSAEWNPARGLRLPNADKKLRAIASTSGQIDVTVISHSAA